MWTLCSLWLKNWKTAKDAKIAKGVVEAIGRFDYRILSGCSCGFIAGVSPQTPCCNGKGLYGRRAFTTALWTLRSLWLNNWKTAKDAKSAKGVVEAIGNWEMGRGKKGWVKSGAGVLRM